MTSLTASTSTFTNDITAVPRETQATFAVMADRAAVILLLLATSALLIRPADLIPALGEMPIYESLIVACILCALPRLAEQLAVKSLRRNSITALVLLLIPAVVVSHLANLDTYGARLGGVEIAKACLFFLLIVSVVNSPRKLRLTLWVVTACVFFEASLAIVQYRGLLHLPALKSIVQTSYDPETGEPNVLVRLCGIGVFNDPNDFALILVVAMTVCVYGLEQQRLGKARLLFFGPLAVFGYALVLTHSRGGLLAAGAALLVFLPARFGWRNTIPLALLLVPVLTFTLSGRQTKVDIDNPEDTFQTRLELWSDSFGEFRSAPIFGIGQGNLTDEIGQVCHNSYLHAYTEMGILGGTVFVGIFYLTLRGLNAASPNDPHLSRLQPYVLALVASYAVGLLSLSRCYTVPTQLILALGSAYLALAGRSGSPVVPRFDAACIRRVFAMGVILLLACYVFLRLMYSPRGVS